MTPRKKNVAKSDFTDAAKQRAGIDVSSFEKEVARLKGEHQREASNLRARVAVLEKAIADALAAMDEGRRGDAARELKRVSAPKPKAPLPPTDTTPRSA